MTHPDIAFKKIRSGNLLTKKLVIEITSWESAKDLDKVNAWCLLFIKETPYFARVKTKLLSVLSSKDSKAELNALLALTYASDKMLLSTQIKRAVRDAFLGGGESIRINATRVLAAQKSLGDATAKRLLSKAIDDPSSFVRNNATVLSRTK